MAFRRVNAVMVHQTGRGTLARPPGSRKRTPSLSRMFKWLLLVRPSGWLFQVRLSGVSIQDGYQEDTLRPYLGSSPMYMLLDYVGRDTSGWATQVLDTIIRSRVLRI